MTAPHELVEQALDLSKADDCIVLASRSSSANVRWANNTSTTNGAGESLSVAITSIRDDALGTIQRDAVTADDLPDLVRASESACEGKPKAADAMPLLSGDGSTPADWTEPAARTDLSLFGPVVDGLADVFARARDADVLTYGYAEHATGTVWLGTSAGIRKRYARPAGKIEITAKSADLGRSTWTGRVSTRFDDIDTSSMWERLAQRLAWSERRRELPAGRYEVLLDPSPVSDMAQYMYLMSARRDADEGRSVFAKKGGGNRIGEKLFAEGVSLYSDPAEPGLEAAPFATTPISSSYTSAFDCGLDLQRTYWARAGVLENLITTRYWAQKVGAPGPVPMIGNMIFDADGGPNLDEMIASTERALLVNNFWYIRVVDPQTLLLTGLTRDGVYLVEGGEVVAAVNNFRYNTSPVAMFANAVEIGMPEPTLPREFEFGLIRMPPLRVAEFNMSSVSEAT